MAGTRVLIVNCAAVAGLMKWPFSEQTAVRVTKNRLPHDARFVKILKVDVISGKVHCLLMSDRWQGDSSVPLPNPEFTYESAPGQFFLPGAVERLLKGDG